ncbi:NAD(P)/FAD-dependent oxidoreductase [Nonlabens tegetincola]
MAFFRDDGRMQTTPHEPSQPAANGFDAVIIGGGAAGLSAAQALGRSLRRTLVIDSGEPRNRFAGHMHNVLGLDGTPPGELIARGRAEAEAYGVEFAVGLVSAVREGKNGLVLDVEGRAGGAPTTIRTRALVVATGVVDVLPDIPGLAAHWGSSVLHCPYCHGWEVRGQRLAVIATSPASLHQAKLLRQWTDSLTVFSAGLGELDAAVERELSARGVALVPAAVTEVVGGAAGLAGVRTSDGALHNIDAVFTAATMTPRDEFLAGLGLERTDAPFGSFLAVDPMGNTSHPRVWAIGNIVNPMATVPIAMGAGAQAGAAVNYALVEEDFGLAAEGTR